MHTGLNAGCSFKDGWEQRFAELLEFKDKHGHCLVPDSYPENRLLEGWAKTQRMYHNRYLRKQSKERAVKKASPHEHLPGLLPTGAGELRNCSQAERRKEYLRRYKAVYYETVVKKMSNNATGTSVKNKNKTDVVSNATAIEPREETTAPAKIRIVARRKRREVRDEEQIWKLRKERFDRLRAIGFFFDRREVCIFIYMCVCVCVCVCLCMTRLGVLREGERC